MELNLDKSKDTSTSEVLSNPSGDAANRSQRQEKRQQYCRGHLRGHAKGVKLEALRRLQSLAKLNKHRIVWASPAWFQLEGICSTQWARKVLKWFVSEGWAEPARWRGRPALRIRDHLEYHLELAWQNTLDQRSSGETEFRQNETEFPATETLFRKNETQFRPKGAKNEANPFKNEQVTGGHTTPKKESKKEPRKEVEEGSESASRPLHLIAWELLKLTPCGCSEWQTFVKERAERARWRLPTRKVVNLAAVEPYEIGEFWRDSLREWDARGDFKPIPRQVVERITSLPHREVTVKDIVPRKGVCEFCRKDCWDCRCPRYPELIAI